MPSPSGSTSKYGFAYPNEGDIPDIPTWGLALAQGLENIIATDSHDILANRPPAGKSGRYFFATDALRLYRDDGTVWRTVSANVQLVFTSSGTWTPPATGPGTFSALVLGGGSGGTHATDGSYPPAGGGGGGEILLKFNLGNVTSSQTVTLGAGGASGANGSPTSIGSLVTAAGGN